MTIERLNSLLMMHKFCIVHYFLLKPRRGEYRQAAGAIEPPSDVGSEMKRGGFSGRSWSLLAMAAR